MTTVIVIDTSEFKEHLRLTGNGWSEMLGYAGNGDPIIAVSDVTILECGRHYRETLRSQASKARDHVKNLAKLVSSDIDLGPQLPTDQEIIEFIEEYPAWLRAELLEAGVTLLPVPEVDLESMLARDLAVLPPFKRDGSGTRDYLIWQSVLTLLQELELGADDELILVTKNYSDFWNPDKSGLHDLLLREVEEAAAGVAVSVSDRLPDVTKAMRAPWSAFLAHSAHEARRSASIEASIVSAAENLAGDVASEEFMEELCGKLGLPRGELAEGYFGGVTADPSTIARYIYDDYGGESDTIGMTVVVEATIDLETFMWRSEDPEAYGFRTIQWDWNESMMEVVVEVDVVLNFDVLVVGSEVENIELDHIDLA